MSKSIGASTRRELQKRVLAVIQNNPEISIEKLQAHVSFYVGLTHKRTAEYVMDLEHIGKIKRTEKGFVATGS